MLEFLLQIYLNLHEIAHMSNHQGGVTPPPHPPSDVFKNLL
jgi:hypothetical protein